MTLTTEDTEDTEIEEIDLVTQRIIGCAIEVHLTYMKLAKLQTGLLINFNERRLIDGVKRLRL